MGRMLYLAYPRVLTLGPSFLSACPLSTHPILYLRCCHVLSREISGPAGGPFCSPSNFGKQLVSLGIFADPFDSDIHSCYANT